MDIDPGTYKKIPLFSEWDFFYAKAFN